MSKFHTWMGHEGDVLDTVNGYDVIACTACQFVHIAPIPRAEDLQRFYQEEFYGVQKPDYFQRHREELEWWNLVYGERYQRFETHLSAGRRRLLDIGSGPGFFLKLGQERGWKTLGIEPSRHAADHARGLGLEIVNEFLSEVNAGQLGRFDVIHMQSVVEHLPDPKGMVRLIYRLLNPDGLLCVTAANDYNPLQQVLRDQFGYQPWWVVPSEHINYFTVDSLKQLSISCGFEVVDVTTTFPMELFLLMGDNYIGNDPVGRASHGRRKNLELALAKSDLAALKQSLYRLFAQYNIGRDIDLTMRRPL